MTQSFLPILALIVGWPCSQAGEVNLGGAVGGQVLSDVLHKFFATREANWKAAPTWKPQVEAMMSLVESMKNLQEADPKTISGVNGMVTSIIDLLQVDVSRTYDDQINASTRLALSKTGTQNGQVLTGANVYKKLKTDSSEGEACHGRVTTLTEAFKTAGCSQDDLHASSCNCSVNSVYDFELVDAAKALRWCDFAAKETAQTCINDLWAEVNKTRATLKGEHSKWLTAKAACEVKRAQCVKCQPLWTTITYEDGVCDGKHQAIYETYRELQTSQTTMCDAVTALAAEWSTETTKRTIRAEEWSDLKFVICIFKSFKQDFNFTQGSFNTCKNDDQIGAPAFKKLFTAAQLKKPDLNLAEVPPCGANQKTVPGLCPALCSLWTLDGCGNYTEVTINTGNTFEPVGTNMGKCSAR